MHVYMEYEPGVWTVGHYDSDGKWHPTADYINESEAAEKVRYLNGGSDQPHESVDLDCLRDSFAQAALTGMIAAHTGDKRLPDSIDTAQAAYEYADAMLAARQRKPA